MITQEYTYPLPDELWVEGVSGSVTGTWTYTGPESIKLYICEDDGTIGAIDPSQPLPDRHIEVTIDASATPHLADLVAHHFIEEYSFTPVFEDITMDNDDVYKSLTNPRMVDAYDCLLYTSPSPRDVEESRMPSSA